SKFGGLNWSFAKCLVSAEISVVYKYLKPRVNTGGATRNRTGVHGFAIRCITTLPLRQNMHFKKESLASFLAKGDSRPKQRPRFYTIMGAHAVKLAGFCCDIDALSDSILAAPWLGHLPWTLVGA